MWYGGKQCGWAKYGSRLLKWALKSTQAYYAADKGKPEDFKFLLLNDNRIKQSSKEKME